MEKLSPGSVKPSDQSERDILDFLFSGRGPGPEPGISPVGMQAKADAARAEQAAADRPTTRDYMSMPETPDDFLSEN